ncbi:hypothetical protein LIP_1777 [Limnochorda pilosa]|uniref:Uncharacterized protein n=1 Tax=Limnochorda pilosa TaxID=1555112 RepID=A0A0K2SKI5_LIMPI|nr:hypothetical protein LIP_1777 [Limnochorda pilosa]
MIYSCFGGTHTSPMAAGIHLGLLPRGRPPTLEELDALPPFDRLSLQDLGRLHLWGHDRHGNRVATVGHGGRLEPIRTAVVSALSTGGGTPPERIRWVDTHDLLTPALRAGGFLSRRLGLAGPGRLLVLRGLTQIHAALEQRVQQVLDDLAAGRCG